MMYLYIYIHVYISLRITILLLKNVCKDTKSHTPTAVDSQPHIFWIEVVHPFDLPSIGFFWDPSLKIHILNLIITELKRNIISNLHDFGLQNIHVPGCFFIQVDMVRRFFGIYRSEKISLLSPKGLSISSRDGLWRILSPAEVRLHRDSSMTTLGCRAAEVPRRLSGRIRVALRCNSAHSWWSGEASQGGIVWRLH